MMSPGARTPAWQTGEKQLPEGYGSSGAFASVASTTEWSETFTLPSTPRTTASAPTSDPSKPRSLQARPRAHDSVGQPAADHSRTPLQRDVGTDNAPLGDHILLHQHRFDERAVAHPRRGRHPRASRLQQMPIGAQQPLRTAAVVPRVHRCRSDARSAVNHVLEGIREVVLTLMSP